MANPSVDAALDAGDLAGEQRALLDLVDKLQFAQLDDVKLPQIVVVGDQSAGKSSVLEAITGTPFPRDAGACTRFATEIRMRRAAEPSLAVSIIPDKNRNYREQERLKHFGGGVDASLSFEALMRQAVELIAPKDVPGRFAARDILVVEKRGPDMPLLTLVDLPGLVRNANNDQSSEDIKTIEALSDRYMKSPRTIILAVVGGNSDYVQAPILTKARRFDPTGSRTLGVLTKPDLTESIGLEDKFLELVQNRDRRNFFKLGWFVLLNPGPREPGQPWPTARERQQRERAFFSRGKWAALPESMCGASALKQTLSVQLQRHIGRHVKTLRRQIQAALDACEADLKGLGEGKDTPEEMRVELVQLFSDSKELVIPAVYGIYKNPPRRQFFRSTADPNGTPAQNLRARATEENDKFSQRVRTHGRKFSFATGPVTPRGADGTEGQPPNDSGKQDFARQEVEMLLRQIRGSEFPMDPKPRAVYMLFQSYAEYWPRLAQEHKDNLGVVCNEFLSEVVDFCWPARMREPLRRQVLDPYMKKLMADAQEELGRLGQDMQLEIQPYDPEYEEKLRNWHVEAMKDGGTFTEAQEVLEKMLIYYELSAKSFIRNVITQVVERHLLQGMYGIFNSMDILRMTNDEVEAIAAEDKATRDRRLVLKAQKKAIEEAKDICASLAMRKDLRQFAEEGELEDTSGDDDDEPKTPSPRDSGLKPSVPKERRRSTRTLREERQPTTQTPVETPTSATYPIHQSHQQQQVPARVEVGRSPAPIQTPTVEWADQAAADGFYRSGGAAPQMAPPPPPRPEKLRAADSESMGLPTPPSQRSTVGAYPAQMQTRESDEYGRYGGDGEYGSGRSKGSKNRFFGRG